MKMLGVLKWLIVVIPQFASWRRHLMPPLGPSPDEKNLPLGPLAETPDYGTPQLVGQPVRRGNRLGHAAPAGATRRATRRTAGSARQPWSAIAPRALPPEPNR